MSLTNPKNVVTEERLSEFYGEILPYLGGMPEVLANKFSKGDLYSTDEKIVGCWTDGKPLYQKTIDLGSSGLTVSTTAWTATSILKDNMSELISVVGIRTTKGVIPLISGFTSSSPSKISLLLGAESTVISSDSVRYLIIQYTKTTDAANSFKYGNETDYSTDEKIVGTWIDGKPIYQKTIDYSPFPNNGIETALALGVLIDTVVNYELFYSNPEKQSCQKLGSFTCSNTNSSKFIKALVLNNRRTDQSKNSIYMVNHIGDTTWDGGFIYGTIQYTKTTD